MINMTAVMVGGLAGLAFAGPMGLVIGCVVGGAIWGDGDDSGGGDD